MGVSGGIPCDDATILLVWSAPASFSSGAGIIARAGGASTMGFEMYSAGGTTRLYTYNNYSSGPQAFASFFDLRSGGWRVLAIRVAPQGAASRFAGTTAGTPTQTAASSAAIPAKGSATAVTGTIGAGCNTAMVNSKAAFCAWLTGQVSDANITTMIDGFRWRYGL